MRLVTVLLLVVVLPLSINIATAEQPQSTPAKKVADFLIPDSRFDLEIALNRPSFQCSLLELSFISTTAADGNPASKRRNTILLGRTY